VTPTGKTQALADELLPRLKRLIVTTLRLEGLAPETIGDDQLLFGEGLGLDSIDALELVVAIEREFSVAIPDGKVDHDVFRSVRTLAQWLAQRLAASEAGVSIARSR
jgi:acyl carrier protein